MEGIFKDEAIVLRKSLVGENDISITVYLKKYGKENIYIPYGQIIKNPIVPISEPFNWFKGVFIKRKEKLYIKEIDNSKNLAILISQDLKKFEKAIYLSKIFNRYVISPDEKMFIFLKRFFYYLTISKNPDIDELNFLVKFIYLNGIFPELERCRRCGVKITKKNFGYISIDTNSVICKQCEYKLTKLDFSDVLSLERLKNIPFKDLGKIDIPEKKIKNLKEFSLDYIKKNLEI